MVQQEKSRKLKKEFKKHSKEKRKKRGKANLHNGGTAWLSITLTCGSKNFEETFLSYVLHSFSKCIKVSSSYLLQISAL